MNKFRIVTNGDLLLGYTKKEVTRNLTRLCNYDQEQLKKLFSGFPFTFKTDLDNTAARRYKEALDRSGIACRIEEVREEIKIEIDTLGSRVISHHPRDKDEFKMKCPKCGKSQPKRLTCDSCDIVIEKFTRQQQTTRHTLSTKREQTFDTEESASRSKISVILTILALLGVTLYFGYAAL